MTEQRLRIAFVVQRYGLEVNGGAELSCRWVAEHLSRHADVHVFTTCAQDYTRWANVYAPGVETLNGVRVHRHAVDVERSPRRFAQISQKVLLEQHGLLDELEWMEQQGPLSASLMADIERSRDDFDVFIFYTYLYATTYYGLQLVPEKAILVPTAHDEPTLYLSIFRAVFSLPRSILYLTRAERRLVHRVFQNAAIPGSVVGSGVDVPAGVDPSAFRAKYGISDDFILYVGRIDESKNIAQLLSWFGRFKAHSDKDIQLVLLGKGPYPIPEAPDIIALGFVSEADKFSALAASSLLAVPSRYESLSMVLLEAWLMGKPVLVNGACEVLREQCIRSNGGLYYYSYEEFSVALDLLMQNPILRKRIGLQGRAFTTREYSWKSVERKYLFAISECLRAQRSDEPGAPTARVSLFDPNREGSA